MRSPASGLSPRARHLAEVGLDMTRFPTAGHLASWARFAPGVKESAGKKKGRGSTGHGNRYLAQVLGEAAVGCRQDRHLPRRTLPAHRPPPRQEEGHRRRRPLHPGHRLAPARPTPRPAIHDLGPDFYDNRDQPRPQEPQPHPPTRSPRLQSHPRTRRLTQRDHLMTRLRCAPPGSFACRPRHHFRIRPSWPWRAAHGWMKVGAPPVSSAPLAPRAPTYVSALVPLAGRAFRAENRVWSPADAVFL